jgi:hypothetical protein
MQAHQEREDSADGDGDEREREVLEADDAVVGGEEAAQEGFLFGMECVGRMVLR